MGKQTSRMYGVKKKTRVNYYEFGDESNGWSITISFSNGVWTVKAGGTLNDPGQLLPKGQCSWWMNGTEYHKGDTIVTFNEGDEVTYHIMEQHRDTIPYTNYMYDIYGNAATNVNYGNKEVEYKLVTTSTTNHEFKVIKYENGIPNSTRKVSDKEITKYKERYSEIYENPQYKVFNLIFDWHGTNPESGHVPMSFECISNSNYISYNGNPKSINQTILEWQAVNSINETIKDDTNKHQAQGAIKSEKPTVALVKRLGGYLKGRQELTSETIMHDVMYDHKEAYYNGHYHKAMYLVYDNPGVEDCWMKKIKNALALTYADPFWFLMTTTSGIEYNGTTYEARKLIRSWKPETSVNMTLTQTISKAKVIPEDEYSDKFLYTVFSEEGSNDIGVYYKQNVPTDNGEGEIVDNWTVVDSEAFGTDSSPITYKKLAFLYSNGIWTIVSKGAHIVYNGKTYKSNKVIAKFTAGTNYTIDIGDESSRYSSDNYEHIVYDIEESEGVDSLTVKKQIVTNVKYSEGHTTKHYTDLDSITFSSSDSPVTFYNIQFKASNGKWTIYSKCGYIKFSGRLYPKNRSILSFDVSERIHIEIADETDKYEVTEVRTYKVETPLSSETVGYEVHTSELTREMKIVKNNNGVEEPWISLKSYQAEYVPYVVDDISFLYFNKTRTWELYSNSDNLYYNGTNYKLGELLASWGYLDNFKISGISVSKPSTDAIQVTTRIKKSSGTVVSNNDVNEDIAWYDEEYPDFNVSFSFKKKIWVFTALRTCWSNGIRYEEGDTITSFKTKIDVDPFSIMCTHGESGTIENILYSVSVMVGTFDGITNVNISSQSRGDITLTDKDISKNGDEVLLLDKNQLKSMYGYIWKKLGSPGPTPTPDFDLLISISYGYRLGNMYLSSYLMRYDLRSTTIDSDTSYSNYGSVYLFYLLSHKVSHGTRIFTVMDSYTTPMPSWGNLRLAWTDNFGQSWTFNMTNFESVTVNNGRYFDIHVCDRTHVYQILRNDTMLDYESGVIRFIKYSILENGNLSKDVDEIITADTYRESYAFWFNVNIGKSSYNDRGYMFDNYCIRVVGRMDSRYVLNGLYDYDLLNHSLITTYRDAAKNLQDYLNITYASYSQSGNTETWTYFANYWYDVYDTGEIYERTDDNLPPNYSSYSTRTDPNNLLVFNNSCGENTVDSISFAYFKIKIRRSTYTSGQGWTHEIIEDLGNIVIRYDHINKSVSTYTISDSQMIDLTFKSSIRREYNGNWYGFKSFQDLIYLTRFDKSTGTCETVKTWEPGSHILVKYFDNSSSYQNKFIKLYLVSDTLEREYLTYDSTNTYRCKLTPADLDDGGLETYSTVAAVHKINYRDSASNCNDKFIFKVANGDRDFKGAIFVFDNINLEGLNVAFRDDYYY